MATTKKDLMRILQEARDDAWSAAMQFSNEFRPTFPYQADGRLTMADISRAHLGGICNGLDAAIKALEDGADFQSLKRHTRTVSTWHHNRDHEDAIKRHQIERDSHQ